MSQRDTPASNDFAPSIGQCAALATIIEATAPKPGNVHRGADFEDSSYPDFVVAATVTAPIFEAAEKASLGQTVLAAIEATRRAVGTNTNLGTTLLLAPLVKVPRSRPLAAGVVEVLGQLTPDDARNVYEAIRRAQPGGLGRADAADVHEQPPDDLVAAMRLAAERDLVARQYANDFQEVLQFVLPALARALADGLTISAAVVHVHLQTMSEFPDSLIARRRGADVAHQSAGMAAAVLAAGRPGDDGYLEALADLDFWLRCDGHQRNPGTTADLLAAGLFAALRDGIIKAPYRLAQ
ncbi:MAG: triphosphoribosyl-dephospho-CoA synthase [Pirellulales bacterium]